MTCTRCGLPGQPYEYKGRHFDGLIADQGERVHPACLGPVAGPVIRQTIGLHSSIHHPGDDQAPLLPHNLKGEAQRVRRQERAKR